jgi:hypothetical protein
VKQLTIYCSRDLEDRVVSALDVASVEGFLRLGSGSGHRFLARGEVPRSVTWEASVIVVPAVSEERVGWVVRELREYAGRCEIEPCLRVVVSPVDQVL